MYKLSKKKEATITINKSTVWMSTTIIFAALFAASMIFGWGVSENTKTVDNSEDSSDSIYVQWAKQLSLDVDDFNECLTSSEANTKVSKDLLAATTAGGRGTPYFVVLNNENGKTAAVSGAVPYANLETAILAVKDGETDEGLNANLDSSYPVLGDKNAGITVLEFSDFQCPFCSRANSGVVAGLKSSDMFKNGEVNLAFIHFPLESIHPAARPAAIASYCAQKQGKFWEYHDLIFANQGKL